MWRRFTLRADQQRLSGLEFAMEPTWRLYAGRVGERACQIRKILQPIDELRLPPAPA